MPANPTSYELRIIYTTNTLQHVARMGIGLEVDPAIGTPFDEIVVSLASGATSYADFVAETLAGWMQAFYGAADDIERAEIWKNDTTSDAKSFIAAHDLSLAGTGSPSLTTRQLIFTMRSFGGHVSKFYLMEPNINTDALFRPPFAAGAMKDLMDYFTSDTTPFLNSDDSFVGFPLGIAGGQNEAIWRKRNRP